MNILKAIKDFNIKKANSRVSEDSAQVRSNTLLTDCTDFVTKEAYKAARTNIRFSLSSGKGCKKIIVTSASPGEGKTTYDIRFRVTFPDRRSHGMIINVEAQKDFTPGYDLTTRGVFYCSRMLSAQMETSISAKDYNQLQKVYSIWICLEPPNYASNTQNSKVVVICTAHRT